MSAWMNDWRVDIDLAMERDLTDIEVDLLMDRLRDRGPALSIGTTGGTHVLGITIEVPELPTATAAVAEATRLFLTGLHAAGIQVPLLPLITHVAADRTTVSA